LTPDDAASTVLEQDHFYSEFPCFARDSFGEFPKSR
jgi:hypothetical protein